MIGEKNIITSKEDFSSLQKLFHLDQKLVANILDSVPAGISIATDVTCKEIRYNQKAAEFLRTKPWGKLSHSTILNMPVKLVHGGKTLTPAEMPLQRAAWKGEKVSNLEIEFTWDDGVRKTSIWNSSPLFDESGYIIGAMATFEDITERRGREDALCDSEERLKALMDNNPSLVFLKDELGRYVYLNQTYEKLFVRSKDWCGKTDFDFWPTASAELFRANDAEVLQSGQIHQYLEDSTNMEGARYCWLCYKFPFTDSKNRKYVGGIGIDVTKRILAEEALRDSEEKYRLLFKKYKLAQEGLMRDWGKLEELVRDRTRELEEANLKITHSEKQLRLIIDTIPSPMVYVDTERRIKFVNEAYQAWHGVTNSDVLGKYVWEVLGEEIYYKIKANIDAALSGKTVFYEIELFGREGSKHTFYMCLAPEIDEQGVVCGYIAQFNDITELRRMETGIARLDRLNLIGEMAAGIGHEVRNPMTTVRGFLQLLSEKQECAGCGEYFNLMISELDRANSIITEFLSLARNKVINLEIKNLNEVLLSLYPMLQADAILTDKHINLSIQEIPDLLLDEQEIRQLVINLVRNGLEAMSPGGLINISTYFDENEITLSVRDRGKGIKPEVLEKIGTPFFTTKDNGTGLGLSVCYNIAVRHNARVEIETGAEGTTFLVRFLKIPQ